MRYIRQHIQTIIGRYDGSVPLAQFLKNYFKQYPVLGSRDRKILTALAYNWYRCAKGIEGDDWLYALMEQWIEAPKLLPGFSLPHWLHDRNIPVLADALFPFPIVLSHGIDKTAWLSSMLTQPHLFIRIRKDKEKLIDLLSQAQIPFTFVAADSLALPNGAKVDTLLPPDAYVVQDASSRQTGTFFAPQKNEQWLDCCSGAGGKSLLLKDMQPGITLTVCDKRERIIHNLQQRFRLYQQQQPTAYVTDVADKAQLKKALGGQLFDNIICDAPCSGSGTWARTPEQLHFFQPAALPTFSSLQAAIATNVSQYLKPGGRLIYITCSVFQGENEDVVNEVLRKTGLQLLQSQLINGIDIKADSMFVAVMRKDG